jgi:hypothetical protein
VLLVLPPLVHRHPGFFAVARAAKLTAGRLGASLEGIVVEDEVKLYEELFREIPPAMEIALERVAGWGELLDALRPGVKTDDLVVVLSARRGTLPWHPRLERLPAQIARLVPESFLIVYPSEADTTRRDDLPSAIALPRGLRPERIVRDLPALPYADALREVIGSGPAGDAPSREEIVAALVAGARDFPTELRPGVVVPHVRVAGIDEPLLYLGTSPAGIDFPHAREPARAIFVLLSPVDRPQEHLHTLAEIARLVSHEEAMRILLGPEAEPAHGAGGDGDG